jgi:hypothetical protein
VPRPLQAESKTGGDVPPNLMKQVISKCDVNQEVTFRTGGKSQIARHQALENLQALWSNKANNQIRSTATPSPSTEATKQRAAAANEVCNGVVAARRLVWERKGTGTPLPSLSTHTHTLGNAFILMRLTVQT